MKKKLRTQIKKDVLPMIEKVARDSSEASLLKDTFNRILVKGNEKDVQGFMQDLTRVYLVQKVREE